MTLKFLIYRQEKITPTNFVVIKAEVDKQVISTEKGLLDAFRKGVTKWATETYEGTGVAQYAGNDINIGDVADYASEILHYCEGITSLTIEGIDAAKDWTYDTLVYDGAPT